MPGSSRHQGLNDGVTLKQKAAELVACGLFNPVLSVTTKP
jgi:hypothetical protein